MTPAGQPSEQTLSAWHRRFPDRRLGAARLRLWRVELPVRSSSALAEWVGKAGRIEADVAAIARRLGLPVGVIREAARPERRPFAFLDLPTGPLPIPAPPVAFAPWPDPIEEVPPAVLRPPGVEPVPVSDDWRTIPIVRAEAVDVVAVEIGDEVEVYAADDVNNLPLWRIPAAVWPPQIELR